MNLVKLSGSIATHIALAAAIALAIVIFLPAVSPLYTIINSTVYVSMAIFALSLALLWGYGGILCFGQSAFFGLGAYAYAIAAINFGNTPLAALGVSFQEVVHSEQIEETGVTTQQFSRITPNEHP